MGSLDARRSAPPAVTLIGEDSLREVHEGRNPSLSLWIIRFAAPGTKGGGLLESRPGWLVMADDDYLPEHERKLLRRHRRKTVRAEVAPTRRDATEPSFDLESQRVERSTGKIPSFRARALSEYSAKVGLVADLRKLLEGVLTGARDDELARSLGTDDSGLLDLERRFKQRVGRSVYIAAVEVVNRAARLRSDALG